ncbi:MAG: hypothetical protein K9M11_01645 [Candidatus Pacebacteria bacterium]|nr:hypothetical protein [Candidatus Paceibacterota bacterium]
MKILSVSNRRPAVWYERSPGEGERVYTYRMEHPEYFTGMSLLRNDVSAAVLAEYQELQRQDIKGIQVRNVEANFWMPKSLKFLKVWLSLRLNHVFKR